jgi:hypothetical protein
MSAGNETSLPSAGRFITSSSGTVAGQFYGFQAIGGSAQISAITLASGFTGASALTAATLDSSAIVNVRFTSILVSSGTLLIYEAV